MPFEMSKQQKNRQIEPDQIVDDKLSIVVQGIETLLKPYQNTVQTKVQKVNGAVQEIVIIATIKV